MKIVVKNDVFNICERIKNFKREYKIYFNTKSQLFELFETNNFVMTLPFKFLDVRVLEYVSCQLKKSNAQKLKEVEDYNFYKQRQIANKIKENAIVKAEKILRRS